MSPSDSGPLAGRPTEELETLLRDPATTADHRQMITDELARRYEEELAAATGSAPPPPPPSGPTAGGPFPGASAAGGPSPGGPAPGPQSPGGPPPGDQPFGGQVPGGQRWAGPFPGATPPAPPVVPPPARRRSRHIGVKVVLALLAVLVIGGGYAAWQGTQEVDSPPTVGFTCVTAVGDCPLISSLPMGSTCQCEDVDGLIYDGFVG
jgi:hypothetical protein